MPNFLVNGESYQWCATETSEQKSHRMQLILSRFGIRGPFTQLDNVFTSHLSAVILPRIKWDGEDACIEDDYDITNVERIDITDDLFHHLESLVMQNSIYQTPETCAYSTAHQSKPNKHDWINIIRTLSFVAAVLSQSNWAEGSGKLCYETLKKVTFGSGFKSMNQKEQRLRDTSEKWFMNLYYIRVIKGVLLHLTDIEPEELDDGAETARRKYKWPLDIFGAYSALFMGPGLSPYYDGLTPGDAIGLELDGILLLDSYMLETSLKDRPRYEIGQGLFALDGERRRLIRVGTGEGRHWTTTITKSSSAIGANIGDRQSNIVAAFSSSRVDIRATVSLDAILLSFTLYAKGPEITIDGLEIDPTHIYSSIRRTAVGLRCGHNTTTADVGRGSRVIAENHPSKVGGPWIPQIGSRHTWQDKDGKSWCISSSMPFTGENFGSGLIAPTEGSPACQWAALSCVGGRVYDNATNVVHLVLQGQRCLECITKDINHARHETLDPEFDDWENFKDDPFMIVMGDTSMV